MGDQAGDDIAAALFTTDPSSILPPEAPRAPMWFERDYAGLPVWAWGATGIVLIGGVAILLTRRGKKKVKPNRRRRR